MLESTTDERIEQLEQELEQERRLRRACAERIALIVRVALAPEGRQDAELERQRQGQHEAMAPDQAARPDP